MCHVSGLGSRNMLTKFDKDNLGAAWKKFDDQDRTESKPVLSDCAMLAAGITLLAMLDNLLTSQEDVVPADCQVAVPQQKGTFMKKTSAGR